MKTILYKASSRGYKNHGWLETNHTFSFADYYNPDRMGFGALRVVNDDIVAGGEGFGKHPHENMEIVSIPLYGKLEHKDSMGNSSTIEAGEIQVMSAGTGILHSEFNADLIKAVNFFQIWIIPNKKNVTPRYQQGSFNFIDNKNKLFEVISPLATEKNKLWLHQDAWFNIGIFDKNIEIQYDFRKKDDGLFAMVIEGSFEIAGQQLELRDAIGIYDVNSISIKSLLDNSKILLIEVPLKN